MRRAAICTPTLEEGEEEMGLNMILDEIGGALLGLLAGGMAISMLALLMNYASSF